MNFSGIVQQGTGMGKAYGFPTANIPFADATLSGIYAARVAVAYEKYDAVVYVDTRRKLLEAHLLDMHKDLYEKEIRIELLEKLREDQEFANEDEARTTIAADVQKAREYHRVH